MLQRVRSLRLRRMMFIIAPAVVFTVLYFAVLGVFYTLGWMK